jgi:hypothetical protein
LSHPVFAVLKSSFVFTFEKKIYRLGVVVASIPPPFQRPRPKFWTAGNKTFGRSLSYAPRRSSIHTVALVVRRDFMGSSAVTLVFIPAGRGAVCVLVKASVVFCIWSAILWTSV